MTGDTAANHTLGLFKQLTAEHTAKLRGFGTTATFAPATRIFDEGGVARRFWLVERGKVALDLHVPGGRAAVIDTLGPGDLLGWGWLFPPHRWHLGATAASHVAALEFDAEALRAEFAGDPAFGHAVVLVCAQVIGERLAASRRRLLDLYGPHGAGTH